MARADLLLNLVRAGLKRDEHRFRKSVEALIVDERAKQHNVFADRLAQNLSMEDTSKTNTSTSINEKANLDVSSFHEMMPMRRLSDLILPTDVITSISELIEEFHRTDLLHAYNLEPRHRLLLIGPPGNGKTSLAEALAAELTIPLFTVRYEAVIASYLGETAVRLSRLFDEVRTKRCVLFFDEFDVVGKERGDIHETGEIKRVVSSLLLQIDDLPSHVVVVTATNHPELLDRAVWRRFQIRLNLTGPTSSQREEWFRRFEERIGYRLGYKPTTLANRLRGLSFAELEQFALDVYRQHVLRLPDSDMRKIIAQQLKHWHSQATPANLGRVRTDRNDA